MNPNINIFIWHMVEISAAFKYIIHSSISVEETQLYLKPEGK